MFQRQRQQKDGDHNSSDDDDQKRKVQPKSESISGLKRKKTKPKSKIGEEEEEEEEEEERKVQQRRAANRKAAFRSRQRRRELAEELQRKVDVLSKNCNELRTTGLELKSKLDLALLENQLLRNDRGGGGSGFMSTTLGSASIRPNSAMIAQAAVPPPSAAASLSSQNNVLGPLVLLSGANPNPFAQSVISPAIPVQAPTPAIAMSNPAHQGNIPGTIVASGGQALLSEYCQALIGNYTPNNDSGQTPPPTGPN